MSCTMNHSNKRMNRMDGEQSAKRVKKECSYGVACYRMNPAHFREYSHAHLESILEAWSGSGGFQIPHEHSLQRSTITEQLNMLLEKELYEPRTNTGQGRGSTASTGGDQSRQATNQQDRPVKPTTTVQGTCTDVTTPHKHSSVTSELHKSETATQMKLSERSKPVKESESKVPVKESESKVPVKESEKLSAGSSGREKGVSPAPGLGARIRDSSYRPVVAPTRRAEDYLKVVLPRGLMRAKHDAAAPYHVFYTAITAAEQTHRQPYSVTFLELLDASLGELQSSLQINFMVEPAWLLAQYYFAGYSAKKLTILYGEECDDMKQLERKPHVDAVRVRMATPFGKHHTKLMLLCYEDGALRVLVSTANLYQDDWDNRTQGLWFSPRCPELPRDAPPHDGESPTMFKRSLLKYLSHYRLPNLVCYIERIKRCDFSHINVFLVASVPGSHFDLEWGMARVGALLRQHCAVPADESRSWPLVAQASSLGSYGAEPKLWLTGDFLQHFTKVKSPPQTLTQPPPLQLIYPSLGEWTSPSSWRLLPLRTNTDARRTCVRRERAAVARRAAGRRLPAVRGRLPRQAALAQRLPLPVARRALVPQPRHAARQVVLPLARRARGLLPADVGQRQQGGVGQRQQGQQGAAPHELRGGSHAAAQGPREYPRVLVSTVVRDPSSGSLATDNGSALKMGTLPRWLSADRQTSQAFLNIMENSQACRFPHDVFLYR